MRTARPTFERITGALAGVGPGLAPDQQRDAVTLLRTLSEGEPVSAATLGSRTGRSASAIEAFLHELPGVYRNDDGDVVGFWGLTVVEMPPHVYRVDGRQLYAWCAWDPFILTPWLGGRAEVRSVDARTGEEVGLRIDRGEVTDLSHEGLVLSFTVPEEWTEDVIASFCHFIHYFTDASSARSWTEANPGTFVLPLDEAVRLGREWARHALPDLRAPA